jgi:hypothetical protein
MLEFGAGSILGLASPPLCGRAALLFVITLLSPERFLDCSKSNALAGGGFRCGALSDPAARERVGTCERRGSRQDVERVSYAAQTTFLEREPPRFVVFLIWPCPVLESLKMEKSIAALVSCSISPVAAPPTGAGTASCRLWSGAHPARFAH